MFTGFPLKSPHPPRPDRNRLAPRPPRPPDPGSPHHRRDGRPHRRAAPFGAQLGHRGRARRRCDHDDLSAGRRRRAGRRRSRRRPRGRGRHGPDLPREPADRALRAALGHFARACLVAAMPCPPPRRAPCRGHLGAGHRAGRDAGQAARPAAHRHPARGADAVRHRRLAAAPVPAGQARPAARAAARVRRVRHVLGAGGARIDPRGPRPGALRRGVPSGL